jgi:hypothetical protein
MEIRWMGLSMAALAVCWTLAQTSEVLAQDRQMYQWTDENGVVHFSDTAPEGRDVPATRVPQDAQPPTASPYQESGTAPSAAQQRREDIARKTEQNQARAAAQEAECAALRTELERLEPNRRVFYTNEEGETERMDDVARTDRVAQLKAQIDKQCE